MKHLTIRTKGQTDYHNITSEVEEAVRASKVKNGIATVFVQHTTASVLVTEDEEGFKEDLKEALERLVPSDKNYKHNSPGDMNAHAHIRAAMIGSGATIPVVDGALALGTWQNVFLMDFDDRPRERTVVITVIAS